MRLLWRYADCLGGGVIPLKRRPNQTTSFMLANETVEDGEEIFWRCDVSGFVHDAQRFGQRLFTPLCERNTRQHKRLRGEALQKKSLSVDATAWSISWTGNIGLR